MLYALGLNHQTAPLAVRERVVFHVERVCEALAELKRGFAREAAILSAWTRTELYVARGPEILSTCNRTELYVAAEQPAALAEWLAQYHRLEPSGLQPYLYTLAR